MAAGAGLKNRPQTRLAVPVEVAPDAPKVAAVVIATAIVVPPGI